MGVLKQGGSLLVVLVAVLIGYFGNIFFRIGALNSIKPEQEHGNENCESLTSQNKKLLGCEDLAEFEDGSIILSCVDRSPLFDDVFTSNPYHQIYESYAKSPGYLFRMKDIHASVANTDEFVQLQLLNRAHPDFHPHGISVITDQSNTQWIYLINHRRDGDVVEIYQLSKDGTTATLKDEVHSSLFVLINDLKPVVLQNKQIGFYVSNSYGFQPKTVLNKVETLFSLRQSEFVFCEPDTFEYRDDAKKAFQAPWSCRVESTAAFGNGVDVSMDGKEVYLVETMSGQITVFNRNETDNTLSKKSSILLSSAGDNLYLDRGTGDLYVGSHANIFQFLQHAHNRSAIAPSQVLRWNRKTGTVDEIFLSNGFGKYHVSGSSVGVFDTKSKTLLIGTANDGAMRCKL